MIRRLFVALLVVAASANTAFALCRASSCGGIAANKRWAVALKQDGTFTLLAWDDATRVFVPRSVGKLSLRGHHVQTLVADSGAYFVLQDCYEGVAIHAADGTLVKELTPKDLLTKAELDGRFAPWMCHPTGVWSWGFAAHPTPPGIAPDSTSVQLTLYTGRTLDVELATGKVLRETAASDAIFRAEGTCASPDDAVVHGGGGRTTGVICIRCKKVRTEACRDWALCVPCAKAIEACGICGMAIARK